MLTTADLFNRWKVLANDRSARPWTSKHMAGFFQAFRPHGDGLEAAFEGIAGAEELLARLLAVYRVTVDGWRREGAEDAYFIVRNPMPISGSQALELADGHLGKLAAMARTIGDNDASRLLEHLPRLEVVEGQMPGPPGRHDPETLVYEMTGNFMASLEPRESKALLMEEAFYTIACDYNLRHYLVWPLYRHTTLIDEPFLPYFELWRHGLGIRFFVGVMNDSYNARPATVRIPDLT